MELDFYSDGRFKDPQDVPPRAYDMYGNELYCGDEVVEWEDGKYLLKEDFWDKLKECGFKEVAEMIGLSVITIGEGG